MHTVEILRIARRYTFAYGRDYLSSFLSLLSMIGLILAIALLIVVLSVMNGFDKEMRESILQLVPHVTVYSHLDGDGWREHAEVIEQHPEVAAVSAFATVDALLMRGKGIETARVIGLERAAITPDSALARHISAAQQADYLADPDGLILGHALADKLGVVPGDEITLLIPAQERPEQTRSARYHVVTLRAVLHTRTELDQSAALVHLPLAAKLAGLGASVSGLRVTTTDIFAVSRIGWELINNLPRGFYLTNWTMTHGNLYSAIQLSRDLISILLFSIIGVAAFNVVSSLVLVVFDKRGDIAILRTLGTSGRQIAAVFVVQGAMIGSVGVLLGSALGVGGSLVIGDLVAWLEILLGFNFLNTDVYPVSFLPVDILPADIAFVGVTAFFMCIAAAIYPALRAAKLSPAAVLHQE